MSDSHPFVSIIIPSKDNSSGLRQTLDHLSVQSYLPDQMEVIVIADGCSDDTAVMVRSYKPPFELRIAEQPASGQSTARNLGAQIAKGEILLFLDDDLIASEDLVAAHIEAHEKKPGGAVIGYVPLAHQKNGGFFLAELRGWWEDMFEPMRLTGHRYAYTDLLSGNMSISTRLFKRAGGFDPLLRCHEDYELGFRLIRDGASLYFSSAALAWHDSRADLDSAFRRKRQEGMADVYLGTQYPRLKPDLLLTQLDIYARWPSKIFKILAFEWCSAGDIFARFFQQTLKVIEIFRARSAWQRILKGLLSYWYWRGVAERLINRQALDEFIGPEIKLVQASRKGRLKQTDDLGTYYPDSDCCQEYELSVDIATGIDEAASLIDNVRPASLKVMHGIEMIGCIPDQPGGERLRGIHLRAALSGRMMNNWRKVFVGKLIN